LRIAGTLVTEQPRSFDAVATVPGGPRRAAVSIDILQALLLVCVIGWVLGLPGKVLGVSLYTEQLLAIALGLSVALAFIGGQRRPRWFDWAGALLALAICAYIAIRYEPLSYQLALLPIEGIIGSSILLLLVLEATRRTTGVALVGIILVLATYVFVGPHMPGDFATRSVSPERLVVYLGLDANSMIGPLLGVAVLIVVPFTLMGQVLSRAGGAEFFADLAISAMGRFRGGAAKIAVVGSALFGMISGSAVSNVVAVGIVTIPLMMRSGFSARRAAAIESVGSTGGQLMPPVMGASAFIMADFLQVPYGTVAVAAIVPSLLFYGALFINVDLVAAREGIGGARIPDAPSFSAVLKSGWHFAIPIAFLIATLVWPEYFQIPIERAALYSAAILVVLCFLFSYRGRKIGGAQMLRAILDSGRAAIDIVLTCAAAGIIVGALNVSGISFGLTLQIIALSGGSLLVLLLLTAAMCLVLGMGMPTPNVYVLTATLLAPSLIKLGVNPMAAHMFVMYFGMLSMITPPVAMAAYAAANIARVSGWATGWTAVTVAWSKFLVPFLFVFDPSLLMAGPAWQIAWHLARNLFGIFVGTAGVVGFAYGPLSLTARLAFAAAAAAVLIPPYAFPRAEILGWAGLGSAVAMLLWHQRRNRSARSGQRNMSMPRPS
jgi:TRAP transporter 4TM/12TM fusion protein